MSLDLALNNWRQWQVTSPLLTRPRVLSTLSEGPYTTISKLIAETHNGSAFFVVRSPNVDRKGHKAHARTLAPTGVSEARHQCLAAKVQLAPALRYVCADTRTLVMDYIDDTVNSASNSNGVSANKSAHKRATTNTNTNINKSAPQSAHPSHASKRSALTVNALATLINGIHAIEVTGQPLDLHAQLSLYTKRAIDGGLSDSGRSKAELINPNDAALNRAIAVLARDQQVLCHNDLHANNVLLHEGHLVAIDWEYSGIGSAYFDLVSAAQGCPGIDTEQLIALTLGDSFCQYTWQCAQAVFAALAWNWYQASGVPKPTSCTFDKVAAQLEALV